MRPRFFFKKTSLPSDLEYIKKYFFISFLCFGSTGLNNGTATSFRIVLLLNCNVCFRSFEKSVVEYFVTVLPVDFKYLLVIFMFFIKNGWDSCFINDTAQYSLERFCFCFSKSNIIWFEFRIYWEQRDSNPQPVG